MMTSHRRPALPALLGALLVLGCHVPPESLRFVEWKPSTAKARARYDECRAAYQRCGSRCSSESPVLTSPDGQWMATAEGVTAPCTRRCVAAARSCLEAIPNIRKVSRRGWRCKTRRARPCKAPRGRAVFCARSGKWCRTR